MATWRWVIVALLTFNVGVIAGWCLRGWAVAEAAAARRAAVARAAREGRHWRMITRNECGGCQEAWPCGYVRRLREQGRQAAAEHGRGGRWM